MCTVLAGQPCGYLCVHKSTRDACKLPMWVDHVWVYGCGSGSIIQGRARPWGSTFLPRHLESSAHHPAGQSFCTLVSRGAKSKPCSKEEPEAPASLSGGQA